MDIDLEQITRGDQFVACVRRKRNYEKLCEVEVAIYDFLTG